MDISHSPFPWGELLEWYEKSGRHDLPWRDYRGDATDLVYRVWISEIFLQQTQVSRVIGYFERVLERFPSIGDLADADYEIFFPYYQGLGYYSRARNILKTAKIIKEEYRGIFPRNKSLLEKLPGVGGYTSSAILAFGYGEPYLAWDTNLEKVFTRYYHGDKNIKLSDEEKGKVEKDFRNFISLPVVASKVWRSSNKKDSLLFPGLLRTWQGPNDIIRAINNALMDFASLIDLKNPENIDWKGYPIKSGRWYESRGSLEKIVMKKSISFPIPDASIVVILHKDHSTYYGSPDPVISSVGESQSREILPGSTIEQDGSWVDVTEKIGYSPFLLPPALDRDTRKYIQDTFRDRYSLELSVRPIHKKWISDDGKPYIAVNAQVQVGKYDFREYTRSEAKLVLDALG